MLVGNKFYEQAYFTVNKDRIRIYGRDITKRKKVEQSSRVAEENLRKSNEKSLLGIRIVDKNGKNMFVNQAVLNMFDYENIQEFETIPMKKRYTPESFANSEMRLERQRSGEPVADGWEVSAVRKDSEIRHLQVFRNEVLWEG